MTGNVRWLAAGVIMLAGVGMNSVHADVIYGSRSSDFTITFSDLTFTDADAQYVATYQMPAQAPVTGNLTTTVLPAFENLSFAYSGGITTNFGTPAPGVTSYPGTVVSDGSAGAFGFGYNTPVSSTSGQSLITLGQSGGLATLTFLGGGGATGLNSFPFTISVALPGDWSTPGTTTGTYQFWGIDPGFTLTTDFVFDSGTGMTTVSAYDPTYDNGATGLNFVLFGAATAIPEPTTWMIMLVGCGALGAAMRFSRRGKHGATTAA